MCKYVQTWIEQCCQIWFCFLSVAKYWILSWLPPPPDHHCCDFAKLGLDQCFPFCGLDSWAEYKIASKPSFTCSVCLKSTSSTFGRNLVEKSTAILTRDLLSIKLHFSLPWSDRKSAKIFLAMEYLSAELWSIGICILLITKKTVFKLERKMCVWFYLEVICSIFLSFCNCCF